MARPSREKEKVPYWVLVLSAASVMAILTALYFLLKIHAPSLEELPLGKLPKEVPVGATAVVAVVLGLLVVLLKTPALTPVRTALAEAVARLFERRSALILAPLAVVLSLGTWWHWSSSARTPILRIRPDGAFLYYLMDADQAAKPPRKTFEIRVKVRERAGEQRLYPQDDRAIDIGASESVLRWRAAREPNAPKRLAFLGTPRLRADDLVTIQVLCRRTGAELLRARAPVSEEPFPLVPLDGKDFGKRMETCDPI
ncbi:MAG TPA: hypothetical protein VH394_20440 [Thermoanaerobaculia bacterium]|jgi:hypothetical protein|nr:hypothetical protein [Thermoanaerobaculia bacterium]